MKNREDNMDTEPIALFDLDSTLADFEASKKAHLEAIASPNDPPCEPWPAKQSAWLKARMALIKNQPGFWRELKPIPAGFDIFNLVGELGYERHILTKGPDKVDAAWTEKFQWCKQHIPPDTPITIGQDKGLVYGRILVDDWPDYITAWLKWRKRGLVIMLDWPHNQDFKHPNVFRYHQYEKHSYEWQVQNERLQNILIAQKRRK